MIMVLFVCSVAYFAYAAGWRNALTEAENKIKEEMLMKARWKD